MTQEHFSLRVALRDRGAEAVGEEAHFFTRELQTMAVYERMLQDVELPEEIQTLVNDSGLSRRPSSRRTARGSCAAFACVQFDKSDPKGPAQQNRLVDRTFLSSSMTSSSDLGRVGFGLDLQICCHFPKPFMAVRLHSAVPGHG